MASPIGLELGFASSKQFQGKTGDVATGGSTFSAFNKGLSTLQIALIGGLAVVALFILKKKK